MTNMEGAKNSERRYNTRFRGVPRSVFTYSRVGKKPGPKPKLSAPLKTDLRDDFIYTKLGKKPSPHRQLPEPPNKSKEIRKESPEPEKPASPEEKVSNGVNHSDVELSEDPTSDAEKADVKTEVEPAPEIKSPNHNASAAAPTVKEFVVSGGSSSKSVWITSKEKLSFNDCNVASYNPKTKMFRCVVCQAVGFMSRIGEHYLGTHCNAKVFQCPQCSYCSAWWRCVRNHMSKNHGVSNAPASMWKNQPLLDEIMQLLQNLKYSVDCEDRVVRVAENSGKRYICPKCPYATDRRDLYNRHENIHREEKPFQCYICYKLFNRADHVKKHFCRIHKDYDYDINLIRRLPSKRSRLPVSPYNGVNNSPLHQLDGTVMSNASNNVFTDSPAPASLGPSKLLNCLTGPPTMVKLNRDSFCPSRNENTNNSNNVENPKENAFEKPAHNSLLSYLTRSNFPSKPPLLEMPPLNNSHCMENCSGKRLQEGVLATFGYSSVHNNVPKEFICPYCPWQSTDVWALQMHTATHYNNACVLCNFRSTKESDMETHMWECHRKRPCNKCNFLADSIMVLDAHMTEKHTTRQAPFGCRACPQRFEVRSDMEAHCIFIHNQVLRECKQEGCDFCSTDPDLLEDHKHERHTKLPSSSSSPADSGIASRTQCLYCGCDFADTQSLCLHEEIFHENSLQIAGRRPLDPYSCSICGYVAPKQLMMMEHLRVHTGQELCCRAGDSCHFHTPYDTVLREHVIQIHGSDDGIVRCPHCGHRCSTRNSFTSHYREYHHPFCCTLCEEVEHKYFVSGKSTSYLDSTIAALFPFAKKITDSLNSATDVAEKKKSRESRLQVPYAPKDANIVETVRRSRKQPQPRKIIQDAVSAEEDAMDSSGASLGTAGSHHSLVNKAHSNNFISLYARKLRSLARIPLFQCRLCTKHSLYFRQKKNFLLHISWHNLKKHKCSKCIQTFRHRYQVLLHRKREHRV